MEDEKDQKEVINENADERTSVFFSYSRVDQKQALPIIAAIESHGYKVWWDGVLEGGTSYLETTEEALESAKAVVVLWSKTSISSHWVRDEAMSGRGRERLIPLSLDGTIAPLGFRQVQSINFEDWKNDQQSPPVQELCRVLDAMHDRPAGSRPTQQQASITPQPTSLLTRRNLLIAGGGVLGVTLAGLGVTSFLSPGAGSLHKNGIAILPFQNLSGDTEMDYLANGLSSEVRDSLARNKTLRVVARSSSRAIAKQSLTAKAMAKNLGVSNILEGSLRNTAQGVKVNVDLINGATGFNRWSMEYIQPRENILSVRTALTEALIGLLTTQNEDGKFDAKNGSTENPAAFNAYLKSKALFSATVNRDITNQALNQIDQAIALDRQFGSAFALRAQILLWLGATSSDVNVARDYLNAAVSSAENAVAISPNLAKAYSTLGYVLVAGKLDFQGARAPYEKSRALGEGDSAILARYATYMMVTAQHQKAIMAIQQATDLDPLNPTLFQTSGLIHYAAGLYEEAIIAIERALALSPNNANAYALKGMAQMNLGRVQDAINSCQKESNPMERLTCLAIGYDKMQQPEQAKAAMSELVELYGDAGMYQQAQILSSWGDLDDAMQTLQKAQKLKDSGLTLAGFDPTLNPLRARADFSNLLAELGL
jgi:TolB-like protein/Flp pilus assembly protein TadD